MAGDPGADGGRRALAQRNRERILRAAYEVLAESGVDAQMLDIARAADVGVATLYRNFATKEELLSALLLEYFERAIAVGEEATRVADPWLALTQFLQWVTTLQLENRAVSQFLAGRIAGTPELRNLRYRLYELLSDVTDRAQRGGQLRPDVGVSDLRAALLVIARLSSTESPLADRLVRRLGAILLDGLHAPDGDGLEGPPLTVREFDRALFPPNG
jgi:AcrR family transcriptional regulator